MHNTSITSILAIKKLRGKLKGDQLTIYNALLQCGDLTNNELERITGLRINSVCGRTNNLKDKGLIKKGYPRLCSVTSNLCDIWRVVDIEDLEIKQKIPTEQMQMFIWEI